MMGEARVPCACEADVYGAATQLLLQAVSDQPVFLVDLVDLDADDDTGVVWHCGQAPVSMADPDAVARATIHTNRKMPLLLEFPLRPGRRHLCTAEPGARQPMPDFLRAARCSGAIWRSPEHPGVVRFDRPAGEVIVRVIDSGLEHHMALAYGDHVAKLESFAVAAGLPVIHL